jgi:adenylate kinase family enzyme
MRRIMIVGSPGSGKTTVGRALGARLGLPVHHLDAIVWRSGWRSVPRPEWEAQLRAIFATGSYVVEGSYAESYQMRLQDCDTLIWLDLNILRRFMRVKLRLWRDGGKERSDLPAGCIERDPVHLRGFWRGFWLNGPASRLAQARLAAKVSAGVHVVHLASPREVRDFLASLGHK